MALETLSSSELLNLIIYDTFSATPLSCTESSEASLFMDNISLKPEQLLSGGGGGDGGVGGCLEYNSSCSMPMLHRSNPSCLETESSQRRGGSGGGGGGGLAVQGGRKKRRRRPKVCKNKEEAETQRMTHIAVERNRRKQMNEHLAVLRSLMPQSYVQRGDQASIVGGAIEYVKELEHMLQSLEAQKFQVLQQNGATNDTTTTAAGSAIAGTTKYIPTPFAQFFSYPQFTCSQFPHKLTSKSKAAIADIEVTLIETHANVRILSQRRVRQLSRMVAAFQTLYLTVLHLNVTSLDPLVLYSISAKVEEGCPFNSADDIAGAVHRILRIIEEEATLCGQA